MFEVLAVARIVSKLGDHSDIKHPNGRIKNWVPDLTCRLITVHHLSATQAPGVVSEIMRTIRANACDNDDIDSSKKPFSRSLRSRPIRSKVRILGQFVLASGTISTSSEDASVEGGDGQDARS